MARTSTTRRKPRQGKMNGKTTTSNKRPKSGAGQAVDPITFSVILNRFSTIANEMTLTMEKTAWTSIIALARDFSCA